jgi:2-phospho-L-lactate guanylyltransferase
VIAAVVPAKALSGAKSRLLRELSRADVERLCLAMLGDVVAALRGVPALAHTVVVTPDQAVAAAARGAGAEVLLRPDPGLNAAIDAAAAIVAPGAEDGVLVVLGDVAGARSPEIERLLRALPGRGVALAASRDGGTCALLRVPRDVIPAAFGRGSAARHRELAARAGVTCVELDLPSLAIDVDEPEDLAALRETGGAGPRTQVVLEELAAAAHA